MGVWIMDSVLATLKVNNEIELCQVEGQEAKKTIERELLHNRISYYMQWPKASIFNRKKDSCIICVNENSKDTAEEIIRGLTEEYGFKVQFLMKRCQTKLL